jgi:hypothetical protein
MVDCLEREPERRGQRGGRRVYGGSDAAARPWARHMAACGPRPRAARAPADHAADSQAPSRCWAQEFVVTCITVEWCSGPCGRAQRRYRRCCEAAGVCCDGNWRRQRTHGHRLRVVHHASIHVADRMEQVGPPRQLHSKARRRALACPLFKEARILAHDRADEASNPPGCCSPRG